MERGRPRGLNVSDDLCTSVFDCLPILMDPPEPNDPEEATIAPLRRHLASCPICQAAATRQASFAALTRNAIRFQEMEVAIAAAAARGSESFLEMVRAAQSPLSKSEPGIESVTEAIGAVPKAVLRLVGILRFPEFRLPPQAALAAADRDELNSHAGDQFFQFQHPEHPVLAEVVTSSGGIEVFVSTSDAALAEAVAEAQLLEHTGRSWTCVLRLSGGVAQWTVPVEAPFGGTYELAIRIELPEDSGG